MRGDDTGTGAVRRRRAVAQLLAGARGETAACVVRRLLAVQAQDLRAARLAVRARSDGLTAADVDRALAEGSLVVGWLQRGTLHLVLGEDYGWLLGLTAPTQARTSVRRLAEEGLSVDAADRALALVERALAAEGPLTRAALAERLSAGGIRAEGQALAHLLRLGALRGSVVLGPPDREAQAFVLARDWLAAPPPTELAGTAREEALAELALRYLAGHGPASATDLAAWSGLPLGEARSGLRSIGSELVELAGGLVDLRRRQGSEASPAPRLLPAFDPYLLGWKDRTFAVPVRHARRVHPGGGVLRAVATVDGIAVGTWTMRRGGRLAVAIDFFSRVPAEAAAALEADTADMERFESGSS